MPRFLLKKWRNISFLPPSKCPKELIEKQGGEKELLTCRDYDGRVHSETSPSGKIRLVLCRVKFGQVSRHHRERASRAEIRTSRIT